MVQYMALLCILVHFSSSVPKKHNIQLPDILTSSKHVTFWKVEYKVWLQNDIQEMDHFKTKLVPAKSLQILMKNLLAQEKLSIQIRIQTMDIQHPGLSEYHLFWWP